MHLSKNEILARLNTWLTAWDEYDLDTVMDFIHDDVVFENWDGLTVHGKTGLQKIWTPWFLFNGNFKFIKEDIFIDEEDQKITFQWCYQGPSFEKNDKGKPETRRGVDVINLVDGKISKKICYSKTSIQIESKPVLLGVIK